VSGCSLLAAGPDDEASAIASDMAPAARWLAFWIDLLIEVARVELRPEIELEPVELASVILLAQRRIGRAVPSAIVEFETNLSASVNTDSSLAERILTAAVLIANAAGETVTVNFAGNSNVPELHIRGGSAIAENRKNDAHIRLASCLASHLSIALNFDFDNGEIRLSFPASS
jgi:hypothetical protein